MSKISLAEMTDLARATIRPISLQLIANYDLRASLAMKVDEADKQAKWTAYLNVAGNLCHVVSPEAELLIRVQFTYPIRHLKKSDQITAVRRRLTRWIVL